MLPFFLQLSVWLLHSLNGSSMDWLGHLLLTGLALLALR